MEKILIGLHEFDGPFSAVQDLPTEPGLLAVLIENNRELELVDIKEATDIQAHWHRICGEYLTKHFIGAVKVAVFPMPELSRNERKRALAEINQEFDLLLAA